MRLMRLRLFGLQFDLIVLDLMMHESGLGAAEFLRKSINVPILMLTAMNSLMSHQRIRAGLMTI